MPDRSMIAGSNIIRCADCEESPIQFPEQLHDDAEVFCLGCGESLGTIHQLRDLLLAALSGETNALGDNDN